jgi:uncharacterized protein
VVKVRVKEVDAARKRIALTMKSGAIDSRSAGAGVGRGDAAPGQGSSRSASPMRETPRQPESSGESALAAALRRAQERR